MGADGTPTLSGAVRLAAQPPLPPAQASGPMRLFAEIAGDSDDAAKSRSGQGAVSFRSNISGPLVPVSEKMQNGVRLEDVARLAEDSEGRSPTRDAEVPSAPSDENARPAEPATQEARRPEAVQVSTQQDDAPDSNNSLPGHRSPLSSEAKRAMISKIEASRSSRVLSRSSERSGTPPGTPRAGAAYDRLAFSVLTGRPRAVSAWFAAFKDAGVREEALLRPPRDQGSGPTQASGQVSVQQVRVQESGGAMPQGAKVGSTGSTNPAVLSREAPSNDHRSNGVRSGRSSISKRPATKKTTAVSKESKESRAPGSKDIHDSGGISKVSSGARSVANSKQSSGQLRPFKVKLDNYILHAVAASGDAATLDAIVQALQQDVPSASVLRAALGLRDRSGELVLHRAVESGNALMVAAVMKAHSAQQLRSALRARSDRGQTPAALARSLGYDKIADKLRPRGCCL